ncbi:MAG: DUF4276 family protein [Pseudomonadota bacterium]|nr:DUF4276 family protein [Pseudomonadota bacterium]
MVRIGISVEGLTEERFVKAVLYPYLSAKNIYVTPISMGGGVNIDKVKSELKKMANSFDYVTTLYDFYGFRNKDANETKDSLEAKILATAHEGVKPKLIPYVQMYEYEGLLFSCPTSMENILNETGIKDWAAEILREFNYDPEAINNSTETAPSKRLGQRTGYLKTTHGPNIASEIGIAKIREMCNGFDAWIASMEVAR